MLSCVDACHARMFMACMHAPGTSLLQSFLGSVYLHSESACVYRTAKAGKTVWHHVKLLTEGHATRGHMYTAALWVMASKAALPRHLPVYEEYRHGNT